MAFLLRAIPMVLLAGCTAVTTTAPSSEDATAEAAGRTSGAGKTAASGVLAGARHVEDFDTTTEAERAAALSYGDASGRVLGRTVASLGSPTEPGFWLETPLVDAVGPGTVISALTGRTVAVELRPIAGPATSGSRISLAAMRLLGVALTDLPELVVFAD